MSIAQTLHLVPYCAYWSPKKTYYAKEKREQPFIRENSWNQHLEKEKVTRQNLVKGRAELTARHSQQKPQLV